MQICSALVLQHLPVTGFCDDCLQQAHDEINVCVLFPIVSLLCLSVQFHTMTLEFVTVFHKNAPIPGGRYGGKECESSGTALGYPAEVLCPTGRNASDMDCERLPIRSIIWLDKKKRDTC